MVAAILGCLHIDVSCLQLIVFPHRVRLLSNLKTQLTLLFPPGVGGKNISVSGSSRSAPNYRNIQLRERRKYMQGILWPQQILIKSQYRLSSLLLSNKNIHRCSSNILHHLKVRMKVYQNRNVLRLTLYHNKFITFKILCFSLLLILPNLFP